MLVASGEDKEEAEAQTEKYNSVSIDDLIIFTIRSTFKVLEQRSDHKRGKNESDQNDRLDKVFIKSLLLYQVNDLLDKV